MPYLFLLLALCALQAAHAQVAFTGATVIDVTDGTSVPDQTVLLTGNRITAVGSTSEVPVPDGAEVVDARGQYLIPGLWDMHVHAAMPELVDAFYTLFIAHGVTGVRDMWSSREVATDAQARIHAGRLAGPRAITAGNLVDGPRAWWPGSQVARTPADGERIVDSLYAEGAPFVKVYSDLRLETYRAIAMRANELGLPFAGHVPDYIPATLASDLGQRSMEHSYGLLEGCAIGEQEMYDKISAARQDSTLWSEVPASQTEWVQYFLARQDEERCQALAERLAANQTWLVPTLVTDRGYAYIRELAAAGDDRLRYMPPSGRVDEFWFPDANRFTRTRSDEDWATEQETYAWAKAVIPRMLEAGVPYLAGSDTPNPWAFPGSGLHDELQLLVEAGMTPLQALQAATLNPARYFERTDDLGTVEAGKLADLVLLEANPLENIAHTQQIRAVVADGRLYRRADLDRLLSDLEAENSRTSVASIVSETLEADGADAARVQFEALLEAGPDSLRFGDGELNQLGYRLLREERLDDAIAVFEMNAVAYPEVPNVHDSLGEALRAAGRHEEGHAAHVRAVELAEAQQDPRLPALRQNLQQAVEELEAER